MVIHYNNRKCKNMRGYTEVLSLYPISLVPTYLYILVIITEPRTSEISLEYFSNILWKHVCLYISTYEIYEIYLCDVFIIGIIINLRMNYFCFLNFQLKRVFSQYYYQFLISLSRYQN